jgi:UPF0176 protein
MNKIEYQFATFYRFAHIDDPEALRADLQNFGEELGIIGIVLLAPEGLNSTIAGDGPSIEQFLGRIRAIPGFAGTEAKYSSASLARKPFRRLRVRVKREIVTMGIDGIDPATQAGTYVEPHRWNDLISDPEVLLIDTRNVYEYRIGTFEGAEDPRTLNFRQFPDTVKKMIAERRPKKIALFCTGGIRCEKATSFVRRLGIDEVYHLKGGILKYLETVPEEDSRWKGKCFVFDGRITVDHDLEAVPEPLCPDCGQVMTPETVSGEYRCIQCLEFPTAQ